MATKSLSLFRLFTTISDKTQTHLSTEICNTNLATEICNIIRTEPRWEKTLISNFPTVDFSDPSLFQQIFTLQKNPFLSYLFFNFLVAKYPFFVTNEVSCSLVFDSLVEAKAAKAAKGFLEETKFCPKKVSLEAYVRCVCEFGMIEDALKVFDEMRERNEVFELDTWNSCLICCVKADRTDIFWKLYGEMNECRVTGDFSTYEYLILALCSEKKYKEGFSVLRKVVENGHVPKKATFNKMITGMCKVKNFTKMSALLHIMIEKNCLPDISTYQEIINGSCRNRMGREGFRIFNDLKDRGYVPDRVMYTTVIQNLCDRREINEARKLWVEMVNRGIPPNEYTYNALIYGCYKVGDLEGAKKLKEEMSSSGLKESTVSYNTVIGGLCFNGRIEEASRLFEEMGEKGIVRDSITYNYLIRGLCKEGKIVESRKLLDELLVKGLDPSPVSYIAIIQKLYEMRNFGGAKKLLSDMKERGLGRVSFARTFICELEKKFVSSQTKKTVWKRLKPLFQKRVF